MKVYRIRTEALLDSTYFVTADTKEEAEEVFKDNWGKGYKNHKIKEIKEITEHMVIAEEEYRY